MTTNTQKELETMCKGIADELDNLYSGYRVEELEEEIDALEEEIDALEDRINALDDVLEQIEEDKGTFDCIEYDRTEAERNYLEQVKEEKEAKKDGLEEEKDGLNFWDYFDDVLDIEYAIGGDGQYRGVRLMVACGGPNIWIDTTRGEVFGAWWTDHASAWLPSEICNEIDSVWEDYYQATR